MSWIATIPPDSKNPNKKLYLFYYDKNRKTTVRQVTKFKNTTTGKREMRSFQKEFDSKQIERSFYNKFTAAISTIKLQAAFDRFIESRNVEIASLQMYQASFKWFIKSIGNKTVQNITANDYNKFIKDIKSTNLSPNSINSYTKHLSVIFNWFLKSNYILKNIIIIEKPQYHPIRIIPNRDLRKIFQHFKKENKLHYYTVKLFYLSGLRISSVIKLRVSDLDFQNKLIIYRNVKGKKNATFPIHKELAMLLREMIKKLKLKGNDKLVPYINRQSFCFFKRALSNNKLNMDYTLHQLRKTLATTLVNYKMSVYDVKNLLDHSNIKTTETFYALAMNERIRKEIDKTVRFVK